MTRLLHCTAMAALILAAAAAAPLDPFVERYCASCHKEPAKMGDLDLAALPLSADDPAAMTRWARVFDRVRDGEMPPKGIPQPDAEAKKTFLSLLERSLQKATAERYAKFGRVPARRLNRVEFENTLHDLLGIDIPLKGFLPDDAQARDFDTLAADQQMSHFLLEGYLTAVDAALDAAFSRALEPSKTISRKFTAKEISSTNLGTRQPEPRAASAVTWSTDLVFVGRMPATAVRESGWYRIRTRVAAVNPPPEGYIWATLRSGVCFARAPVQFWIGSMNVTAEPKDFEFTAWIEQRHILELRPGDHTIRRESYNRIRGGGLGWAEQHGVPGVAIQSLEMERVYPGGSADVVRERLFGSLRQTATTASKRDVALQMKAFATRAFRRPVGDAELAPYLSLATRALEDGQSLPDVLRSGYRAILCSPRFLYFQEAPGRLDSWALASRLSYFLWSTAPDEALLAAAARGQLSSKAGLHAQVERMLNHPKARALTENFTGQWLNLRNIDFTAPDQILYPEFDEVLKTSMLDETYLFFDELLRRDLSARNIVGSDFTFLNSRLAKHYGIPGVGGEGMQRVALAADSQRGGVLTQGSVLKVTANGTTSSPVVRGVWVTERILGQTVPPPPEVAAVEPDIRGSKTIREQLDKHRNNASCAVCHTKIDPPGFALESYDPIGAWRDHYRALPADGAEKQKRWRQGLAVDASYTMADGKLFRDIGEFKQLLLAHPDQIARALAEQLVVYGTGARISFGDRAAVESIVAAVRSKDYGVRSLMHAVTESPLFLNK